MPRPKAGYRGPNGEKLPGMSQLGKMVDDPGGLIGWSWKGGFQAGWWSARHQAGVLTPDERQPPLSLNEIRKGAFDAGSLAHTLIQSDLTGSAIIIPEELGSEAEAAALKAYDAWQEWKQSVNLEPISVEEPMIHPTLLYGGTPDLIAWVSRRRCLIDWKTSSGGRLYLSALVQVAGYILCWEALHPDQPIDMAYIVRLDKATASYSLTSWDRAKLAPAERLVPLLREAHDLVQTLKPSI